MAAPRALIVPDVHLRAAMPPERFAADIVRIEDELDRLHPAWRQPIRHRRSPPGIIGSQGITDLEVKARVKWLLQRRKHLYQGEDLEVVVKAIPGTDGRMVAMPLFPRFRHTPASLRQASERPMAGKSSNWQQASLPKIADRLGVSLESVEAAILDAPAGANLYAWARKKIAARGRTPQPVELRSAPPSPPTVEATPAAEE